MCQLNLIKVPTKQSRYKLLFKYMIIFMAISIMIPAIACSEPTLGDRTYLNHVENSNVEKQIESPNEDKTPSNLPTSATEVIIKATAVPTHTPIPIAKPSPIVENSQSTELEALFTYSRAVHALRIGEYDEAIKRFNQVVKRMPNLAIAYKGRGAAYYYLGKVEFALEDLNKSLEIDRDLGGTYLYLGMIFRDQGNLERAKSELEKATTLIHPIREYWELLIAEQTLSDLETQ